MGYQKINLFATGLIKKRWMKMKRKHTSTIQRPANELLKMKKNPVVEVREDVAGENVLSLFNFYEQKTFSFYRIV